MGLSPHRNRKRSPMARLPGTEPLLFFLESSGETVQDSKGVLLVTGVVNVPVAIKVCCRILGQRCNLLEAFEPLGDVESFAYEKVPNFHYLTSTQDTVVLNGFRHEFTKQTHHNPSSDFTTNLHIKNQRNELRHKLIEMFETNCDLTPIYKEKPNTRRQLNSMTRKNLKAIKNSNGPMKLYKHCSKFWGSTRKKRLYSFIIKRKRIERRPLPEFLTVSYPVSKRDSGKRCFSLYRYRQLLFPGNGGFDSTDSAGFRLRKSGGSDSTVLSPAPLRFSLVLGSKVELGRTFALTPTEAVVLFRWWSDYCGDGVCMPMKGFVTWSRRGGLVTRVPRSEDYDTCSVDASRGKEEAPFWVRTMGLEPNRFMV
ncbi:LOW QUALITY PROTEIN: hypothetical protein HID58_038638 [Brassica napus]|uniref:Uncharacterized protein n=1 Tax=Brassica napus TaxID=3708 RepID=A0ABQ8BPP5_BRANA|nr:LOW QUALITY PROTEIN: hypothetical protein HID58_038638 [Brassica napus]